MATQDDPNTEPVAAEAEAGVSETKDKQRAASPADSDSQPSSVTSPTSTERDEAEAEAEAPDKAPDGADDAPENPEQSTSSAPPPLPTEPVPEQSTPSVPPLPAEPVPGQTAPAAEPEDDGWEYHWNASTSSYWFYNRFTQVWQENNPRLLVPAYSVPSTSSAPAAPAPIIVAGQPISDPTSVAGGYNPAIHGDYDPNAWYARAADEPSTTPAVLDATTVTGEVVVPGGGELASAGFFNRATGAWQRADQGPERHSDAAKSRRQLNNFFDVDAAANEHDGRSLKAERSGKKPSKAELKAYKERRRARKEEKRRAWLRD
jgi:hypothetical protein